LPEDKLREIYRKNSDVKYKILDDKVMNMLIDTAKITDVKPDNKIIS
jgi:hypothetical protein